MSGAAFGIEKDADGSAEQSKGGDNDNTATGTGGKFALHRWWSIFAEYQLAAMVLQLVDRRWIFNDLS